jgi:hypothetical protein
VAHHGRLAPRELSRSRLACIVHVGQLADYLRQRSTERVALNKMQYAVGRLETCRLALSGQTDIEHVASLRRRFGREAE